ncbi:MAG: prepilin-type N-terminal cleavage/methylation domain-containing protein [Acidimicrobiia bacterium]|nr:prepilin-type N-terminal cleavage/methylation domain-containing protein [Acidimicrobiia bacterium]
MRFTTRSRTAGAEPGDELAPAPAPVSVVRQRLGDLLVGGGLVNQDQLATALARQQQNGVRLGRALVEEGVIDEASLLQALADQVGTEVVDLRHVTPSPEAVARVPEGTARELEVLPVSLEHGVPRSRRSPCDERPTGSLESSEGTPRMNLRKTLQDKTGRDEGFTLVELLVVIVILGVLSAVVMFSVAGITNDSKQNACEANVKSVQVASEAYRATNGSYAPNLQELVDANLLRDVPGGPLQSPYMTFTVEGGTITYSGDGSVAGC